jgi:methyl coenzyme M reductase beta subunit
MVNLKELARKYGEKEDKIAKNISKKITFKEKKKTQAKSVLKGKRMTTRLPDYKAPSILNDPNRFFKDTMEETKKSLYFE